MKKVLGNKLVDLIAFYDVIYNLVMYYIPDVDEDFS